MGNGKGFSGFLLIGIGTIFLLQSFGYIDVFWSFSWPLLLLIVSVAFHLGFFLTGAKREQAGVLVPGGILLVISMLFMFEQLTNWSYSGVTWPIYLFAVAFGLFELWFFGNREFGLLIPIFILSGTGAVFLMENLLSFNLFSFWPVILIVIGIYLLFGQKSEKKKNRNI